MLSHWLCACPACFSGPLRERLLRYYAETADQVKRLLRVTANGKAQNQCQLFDLVVALFRHVLRRSS